MNISKTQNGTALTIGLEGKLDTLTAPELETVIKKELDGVTELKMDLSNLEYISSSGLRLLLSAQKTMDGKGTMTVLNPGEMVNEVLEVTGFSDILNIERI